MMQRELQRRPTEGNQNQQDGRATKRLSDKMASMVGHGKIPPLRSCGVPGFRPGMEQRDNCLGDPLFPEAIFPRGRMDAVLGHLMRGLAHLF